MQKNDPLVNEPDVDDFLILTTCDIETNKVEILGTFIMKNIIAYNGIGEPKLDHLKKNKVAIYLDDIRVLDYDLSYDVLNE